MDIFYVCSDCFKNTEIQNEISASSTIEVCSLCGKRGPVVELSNFNGFFKSLLGLFEPSTEGRPLYRLIQDDWDIFGNDSYAIDILNFFIESEKYIFRAQDNVKYNQNILERTKCWDRLKESVKKKTRFFSDISDFEDYQYLQNTTTSLEEGYKLFRARIIPENTDTLTIDEMGCPPAGLATAGRANPQGISYLYLCNNVETTFYEIKSIYLDKVNVGTFYINRRITIVDFTYDVNLYLAYTDNGDTSLEEIVIRKKVVEAISKDLSLARKRYDSDLEYIPTQLICEYCTGFADGICFQSSLHKEGKNYVLFNPKDDAKCLSIKKYEIDNVNIEGKQIE